MGLHRRQLSGVGCAVCLWLLQRDADLYAAWLGSNGAVQAENVVHLLPNGDDDADDLQDEAVEGLGIGLRNKFFSVYINGPPVCSRKSCLQEVFLDLKCV